MERVKVSPAVSVYLRHQTWWVDVRREGRRAQRNLHTPDRTEAIRRGLEIEAGAVPPTVETLSKALERYMTEYSAFHHRAETSKRYRQVLSAFIERVGRNI